MSSLNTNQIGEANVRVTADTSALQQGLDDAKKKTEEFASEANAATASAGAGFVQAAGGAAALAAQVVATAAVAFELGHALTTAIDTWKNGTQDFKDPVIGTIGDQVAKLRKEVEELQKVATDNGKLAQLEDWAELVTGGLYKSSRTEALRKIDEENRRITDRQIIDRRNKEKEAAEKRLDDAKKQIEAENIAALDGQKRLEAQREKAVREAQKKYGPDAPEVIDAINRRYDVEQKRLEELEARRKQLDDERAAREEREREERRNAYMELIREQQRAQIEVAEKTALAIRSAFEKARTDFAQFLSLRDLVTGVQALNANLESMRRNRQQQVWSGM